MAINTYHAVLEALIRVIDRLNIVIVGANDGRINDPIYEFVMKMADRTNMLLIEPNKSVLPYLQENYSSHPSYQIANNAIGEEGILTLYAIKKDCWTQFQPAYAKGWPLYRAATGITSSVKSHLEKALIRENLNPDDSIEVFNIPAKGLNTLLAELERSPTIDVLQIDAEGCDDLVIYASDIENTQPRLIYFESQSIPKERMEFLLKYLSGHCYKTYRIGGDSLSVYSRVDSLFIFLNIVVILSLSLKKLQRMAKGVVRAWNRLRKGASN